MKILWFTWKDKAHPQAGGAETVNEELAERLAAKGHEVIFLVSGFKGAISHEVRNGFKIIRVGRRVTVYWQAYRCYKKYLEGWADVVIDEINTMPFFCKFYIKEKNVLFIHQLCRKIWFYQMSFPLSLIGYMLEPFYLWLLRDRKVITISKSTKDNLIRFGFDKDKISIISEGLEIKPIEDLKAIKKYRKPTILSLGAIRAMKRTDHVVRAFFKAKRMMPDLRLIVAGAPDGKYGQRLLKMIESSQYNDSIRFLGKVSSKERIEIMQKAHLICAASVKEGWGLTITEAASQGTPAVVYNVDGLRDAVNEGKAGLICKNTPEDMSKSLLFILRHPQKYQSLRKAAYSFSLKINFDKSYRELINLIDDK